MSALPPAPRRSVEEPPLGAAMKSTLRQAWATFLGFFGASSGGGGGEGGGGETALSRGRELARRLLALTRPHWGRMAVAMLGVVIASLLGLAGQRMVKYLVDAVTPGGGYDQLARVTLIMIAIFVAQFVVSFFTRYLISVIGLRVVMELRLRLFEQLQRLSLSFYSSRRTGELVSRVMNDVNSIHGTVTGDLAGLIGRMVFFFGALGLIIYTEWRLTLLLFFMVPTVSLISGVVGRIVREISVRVNDEQAGVTTVLEEAIRGVRVVRSFAREEYMIERFRQRLGSLFGFILERLYLSTIFTPLMSLIFASTSILLLWFGGRQVLAGRMSTGDLVMYISLVTAMGASVQWVGELWNRVQEAMGASRRLFELLELKSDLPQVAEAPIPAPIRGAIRFEGVSFAYRPAPAAPGASEAEAEAAPALVDIDLDIRPGETLALVGPSGAGKTTLCNLVPRFYDPTAGRVLIDGVDLRQVDLKGLRRQIGVVPQEAHLFGGSIRENLLFGRLEASEEEMIEAARAANAHGFILEQPKGYDSEVGEMGHRLSGGQRQRLAIARALLSDPRILLLDEATSALDSESERLVQEAMERLTAGRTTILIAHRLSTVRKAHRIAVLRAGRLVELGTHDELMNLDGLYARLYRLQFREPGEKEPEEMAALESI